MRQMLTWVKSKIVQYKANSAARHLYRIIIACLERDAEKAIQAEAEYGKVFGVKHFEHESAQNYHGALRRLFASPVTWTQQNYEQMYRHDMEDHFQNHFQYIQTRRSSQSAPCLDIGKKMFDVWVSLLDHTLSFEQIVLFNHIGVSQMFGSNDQGYFQYYAQFVACAALLARTGYKTNTLTYYEKEIVHLLQLRMLSLFNGIKQNQQHRRDSKLC